MRLLLERFGFGLDSTIGRLYVPGIDPVWTLEDEYRDVKVYGETCIPYGEYELELRRFGGFHERYSERYGDMHDGMLWLRMVPGFSDILIHTGNREDQTKGCILVGERGQMNDRGEFTVGRSRDAYRRIYPVVREALQRGEEVWLKVERRWSQLSEGAA